MEQGFEHVVYSRNVIEFVTVANEFCGFLENCDKTSKKEFVTKAQKLLPLLYLKGALLPVVENELEENLEKFVTEADWDFIHSQVERKLASHNEYLEVFDELMKESDSPIIAKISEKLADTYQDIKDFLTLYRIGNLEIMNDALWELRNNFGQYWGQSIVNVLRAIHNILFTEEDIDADEESLPPPKSVENIDLTNSIISQQQREYRDNF